MTPEQMRRALELEAACERSLKTIRDARLAKRSQSHREELSIVVMNTGGRDPTHKMVPLSDEVRKIAFRHWLRSEAITYNAWVRELHQIGASTKHRAFSFDPGSGLPMREDQP